MADQILEFRTGLRGKRPGKRREPLPTDVRTDGPHTESNPAETIELITRGRQRQIRLAKLLWVFKLFSGLRFADVLIRPKSRIQFVLWLTVLSVTGVSAAALVFGTLETPPPPPELVDSEGVEGRVEVSGTPQPFMSPENSIAITPGAIPVELAEPAVGFAERLDAGPSFTQMSGDAPRTDSRGAWLDGTIQDDVVEIAPFGR